MCIRSQSVRSLFAILAISLFCDTALGQKASEGFEDWNLEPGVGQAHLVMLARVSRITRVTVIEGAKTDVALREYRFQPVRVLKGIFQRDELSMTASDLGLSAESAGSPAAVTEGEFRLLILAQPSGITSLGCVSATPGATTFAERVPQVIGPDDPLIAVLETLIQVADSRSRRAQAEMLIDRLANTDGLAAVPLLSSLRVRADWAASDERAYPSLARLIGSPIPAVRGGALRVLQSMLASGMAANDAKAIEVVAESLRDSLQSDDANTNLRVAAIQSLGYLLLLNTKMDWARELLTQQLIAATYAERTAAVVALANIDHLNATTAVQAELNKLPLDESFERELIYARAAINRDRDGAERILLARLERSIEARQSIVVEVQMLGELQSSDCLPLLLSTANQSHLSWQERSQIATTMGEIGGDQVVPVLIDWLRSDERRLRPIALTALESIDTELAAQEMRPLLKTEPLLAYKLRVARLLARHGIDDGYAMALEHLSDNEHAAAATLVLVAINDPRTEKDLSVIIATRPDRRWRAAALTGLAAIGDAGAREQLLDILNDDRNPMQAEAAQAAGIAGDAELLPPLAKLVQSRNRQLALTSLVALRRFFTEVRSSAHGVASVQIRSVAVDRPDRESLPVNDIPAGTRDALAASVASLLEDAYVDADIRYESLAVARLLGGDGYTELLNRIADQPELEGTPLLTAIQAERHQSRISSRTQP